MYTTEYERRRHSFFRKFVEWGEKAGITDPQNPTADDFERYVRMLARQGFLPKTIHPRISIIRQYFITEGLNCNPPTPTRIRMTEIHREVTDNILIPQSTF